MVRDFRFADSTAASAAPDPASHGTSHRDVCFAMEIHVPVPIRRSERGYNIWAINHHRPRTNYRSSYHIVRVTLSTHSWSGVPVGSSSSWNWRPT